MKNRLLARLPSSLHDVEAIEANNRNSSTLPYGLFLFQTILIRALNYKNGCAVFVACPHNYARDLSRLDERGVRGSDDNGIFTAQSEVQSQWHC